MAFVKYLNTKNIRVHCQIATKEALLDFLAVVASESDLPISQSVIREKLFEREETMSTGIGNGVCVPHTMLEGIQGLHAFVITLKEAIPFESVDNQPVNVVIGLFGDPDNPQSSLGALATLGRMLRDEGFVQSLGMAQSPDDIYHLLSEKELNKES